MNCIYCNLVMEEAQAKATLLCGHTVHTKCFIIEAFRTDVERMACMECQLNIVTPEIYGIVYPVTTDSCKTLHESSEDFRNDIKLLITKHKEYTKNVSKFKRKLAPILSDFKTYIKPQIYILKMYINAKLKLIKETEEFIDAKKKESLLSRFFKKMYIKYNLSPYEFRNFVRTNNKIILLNTRYQSLNHRLLRKFRIRI